MAVSSVIFYALYWGVPLLIFVVMFTLAGKSEKKPMKMTWLIIGLFGAGAYYAWFEFSVKIETLAVYQAESCENGNATYHLPFGDGVQVKFDAQPADPNATWIAIQNLTNETLVIDEAVYTQNGRVPTGGAHFDGYEIPSGETHGLIIAPDNVYFLEPAPDTLQDATSGGQFHKYAVLCAN